MIKTKLAKAITVAIAGTALSMSATTTFASTTMYNTFTTTATSATDGWTRTFDNGTTSPGIATGPQSQGNKGSIVPWLGTSAGALPLGYTGSSHLNWAVKLSGAGDSATISAADSLAKYGTAAEIDTGGGAWNDNGLNASGVATTTGPTGWRHQTDIGIIQSDVAQFVTLNLSTIGGTFSRFGVTVFDGVDTNTANYSHHGAWNAPGATTPSLFTKSNPFGTTGLTNVGYSDNVNSVDSYSFLAEAGKQYSVYLGGVGFSRWNTGVDGYALNIKTTSPVPLPGAVWLFGSALAGFVGLRRRKLAA
ncbi:VPLPA-CTERM sorting domain-containing protein [Methylobacter psychrophilus]|uniref:VPLPA-CTERM sorting domain-containing protein n=1 Tax=Methylobacter psychrophilus TaxID=96941 RepID=UPI0021D49D89|nr:VPLPA-CTERM sorting domain-containing protein [Methylobacter psychrophilus]